MCCKIAALTIVWHGQDGYLCDGAIPAVYTPGTLERHIKQCHIHNIKPVCIMVASCELIGQFDQGKKLIGQLDQGKKLIGQLDQSKKLIGQFDQSKKLIGQFDQGKKLIGQFDQSKKLIGQVACHGPGGYFTQDTISTTGPKGDGSDNEMAVIMRWQ